MRKNTFDFFVSKAKPILKKSSKEIAYSTLGAITGGAIVKTHSQTKKQKCLKKNPVQLSDSHNVKMKKLRLYGKCLKK